MAGRTSVYWYARILENVRAVCVCVCNCCSQLESNSALVNCSMHSHIEMESWELAGEMGEKAIKRMRKCVFVFRELNFVILFYEAFLKSFYRRCDSFRIWAHVSKVVCVCEYHCTSPMIYGIICTMETPCPHHPCIHSQFSRSKIHRAHDTLPKQTCIGTVDSARSTS